MFTAQSVRTVCASACIPGERHSTNKSAVDKLKTIARQFRVFGSRGPTRSDVGSPAFRYYGRLLTTVYVVCAAVVCVCVYVCMYVYGCMCMCMGVCVCMCMASASRARSAAVGYARARGGLAIAGNAHVTGVTGALFCLSVCLSVHRLHAELHRPRVCAILFAAHMHCDPHARRARHPHAHQSRPPRPTPHAASPCVSRLGEERACALPLHSRHVSALAERPQTNGPP